MWTKLKAYLIKAEPYSTAWKIMVAFFMSALAGKGFSILDSITEPGMNYLVLSLAIVLIVTSINTLKGIDTLFFWLGFLMVMLNAGQLWLLPHTLLGIILALAVASGVLKNLDKFQKAGLIK